MRRLSALRTCGIRIGILVISLASSSASAATDVTFTMEPDSSRDFAQAVIYRNFFKLGSNYQCRIRVRRPDPGEAPLLSAGNRVTCDFNLDDGRRTENELVFGRTLVSGDEKDSKGQSFSLTGEFAFQTLNALHAAFKESRKSRPSSLNWTQEIRCQDEGKACREFYALRSHSIRSAPGKSVPQVACMRDSELERESPVKLDRSQYASDEEYLEDLTYEQLRNNDRGIARQTCMFFVFDASQTIAPRADETSAVKLIPRLSDLRNISYQLSTTEAVRDGKITAAGRYASNLYLHEQNLNPYLSRSLSAEAGRYAKLDFYGGDSRMVPAYNAVKDSVIKLYPLFGRFKSNLTVFAHMLTLIPDPDRWFLIAAFSAIDWRPIPSKDFLQKVPRHWREFGNRLVSYRQGNTIYLNQGFLDAQDSSEGAGLQEGFENWLLWEVLKLWIPPTGEYDFEQFGERFSRFLLQGKLDEFRAKDAAGHAGLTFLDLTESIQQEIRKTSQWPWHEAQSVHFGQRTSQGLSVEFLAPIQIVSEDGKTRESYSFQFERPTPGHLDGKHWISAIDVSLFCSERGDRFPTRVTITPYTGTLVLQGTSAKWKGLVPFEAQARAIELKTAASCVTDLTEAAKQVMFKSGERLFK